MNVQRSKLNFFHSFNLTPEEFKLGSTEEKLDMANLNPT